MSVAIADRIRHEVLEPTMDARALNLDQAKALHNPDTAEVDSVLEYLDSVRSRIPAAVYTRLVDFVWLLVELNGREGQLERHIAGAAEKTAAEAYYVTATQREKIDRQRIARELRAVLDVFRQVEDPRADNPPAREVTLANGAWRSLSRLPLTTLQSRALARDLGRAKTAQLAGLVAQLERSR